MSTAAPHVDRQGARVRPEGSPSVKMTWSTLAFLHWTFDPTRVQALLPDGLEIDTFEGNAYVGIVPFTMTGVRHAKCPPVPGTHSFHELNVRTYVTCDGVPGVWFFSLDAASRLAVRVARMTYSLPYYSATMSLQNTGKRVKYTSRRAHRGAEPALFSCVWEIGDELPPSEADSLDYFLTERYCLYAHRKGALWRGRIFHEPWRLRNARLDTGTLQSSMLDACGLSEQADEPVVRYAESIDTEAWALERV
ncbi:MAG: YqjF family protein [Phycisphaerales bacterium JB043]